MSAALFLQDAYVKEAPARVVAHTPEGGVILDQSLFYATSGGQPGDSGQLIWDTQTLEIATTVKAEAGAIALVPAAPQRLPPVGAVVRQKLDWSRRHHHMRVHTALHLLSVAIALPVTGGSISLEKGRLDFDMPEPIADKDALSATLNHWIDQDLHVTEDWISQAQLAANPDLVKTLSVQPPKGAGKIRLIRIGHGPEQIDLQPCGGTHVARTSEIGRVRIGKVENKGRQNRRVYLHLEN